MLLIPLDWKPYETDTYVVIPAVTNLLPRASMAAMRSDLENRFTWRREGWRVPYQILIIRPTSPDPR